MNADSPQKRAVLSGWARFVFYLLGKFWLTWLALLAVVVFGLFRGWITPNQWGEGVFLGGVAQVLIAGVSMVSSSRETDDSAEVRYVSKGSVNDTFEQLVKDTWRLESFGLRAFVGGVLMILVTLLL